MFHRVHWPATSNSPMPSPSHPGRTALYLAFVGGVVALVFAGVIVL